MPNHARKYGNWASLTSLDSKSLESNRYEESKRPKNYKDFLCASRYRSNERSRSRRGARAEERKRDERHAAPTQASRNPPHNPYAFHTGH